jgi:hypothetical protein
MNFKRFRILNDIHFRNKTASARACQRFIEEFVHQVAERGWNKVIGVITDNAHTFIFFGLTSDFLFIQPFKKKYADGDF